MLSTQRCRRLLGDSPEYSDAELDRIRGALYGLAANAVALFERSRRYATFIEIEPVAIAAIPVRWICGIVIDGDANLAVLL